MLEVTSGTAYVLSSGGSDYFLFGRWRVCRFAGYLTWYSSQSTKRIYEFKVGVLRAKGVPESEIAKHLKSDANGEHIAHTNS